MAICKLCKSLKADDKYFLDMLDTELLVLFCCSCFVFLFFSLWPSYCFFEQKEHLKPFLDRKLQLRD